MIFLSVDSLALPAGSELRADRPLFLAAFLSMRLCFRLWNYM